MVDDLMMALLVWAAAQMGQPVPPPPQVALVPPQQIADRFHGPQARTNGPLEVVAVYDPPTATVYLPQSWRPDTAVARSILLHEIVHHVQAVNDLPALCAAQWEEQAYELQARWLAAQGVAAPYEAIGVNRFTVKVLSLCGRS